MKGLKVFGFLLLGVVGWGQEGSLVNLSKGPDQIPYQKLFFYTGSNLTYVCATRSHGPSSGGVVASATEAAAAVLTVTAHGFDLNSSPRVTFSGATGNWVGLNTTFTITPLTVDTFSVPLASTGFGTLAGSVTFTTRAPRLANSVWSVQKMAYDGSNNLVGVYTSGGQGGLGFKCSDRATLEYR